MQPSKDIRHHVTEDFISIQSSKYRTVEHNYQILETVDNSSWFALDRADVSSHTLEEQLNIYSYHSLLTLSFKRLMYYIYQVVGFKFSPKMDNHQIRYETNTLELQTFPVMATDV